MRMILVLFLFSFLVTLAGPAIALSTNKDEEAYRYWKKGKVFQEQGQYTKALETYQRAISLVPKSRFYYSAGGVFALMKSFDEALQRFEQAALLTNQTFEIQDVRDPSKAEIEYALGTVYHAKQNLEESLYHYKISLSECSNSRILYDMGVIYQSKGNFDMASSNYDEALKQLTLTQSRCQLIPEVSAVEIHFAKATLFEARTEPGKALQEYLVTYQLLSGEEPGNKNQITAEVCVQIGRLCQDNLKDLAKALHFYNIALKRWPKNNSDREMIKKKASLYQAIGRIYLARGETREAVRNFEKAIELLPTPRRKEDASDLYG